jgi:serine phosphatase RsbU (regulator of sigma subunit)/CBS domain-containing protein
MPTPEWTVRKVMQPDPIAIPPTTRVQEAMKIMNERRIGALLVQDDAGTLHGIFTERDLLRRVVDAVPGWRDDAVADWMTRSPHTIAPDLDWDDAVGAMAKHRVRHLPVVENGRVIGLISSRSLMVARNDFLNQRINQRTAELREANDLLIASAAETRANLRAAGKLHRQLVLPKAPPDIPGLRWALHYKPVDHLGGDYYDFAEPAPGLVGMLIADGAGHSIPAALLAVLASVAFNDVADRFDSPGTVLTQVSRRLEGLAEEKFVSAFYGVLDATTKSFRYATAGHPPPLLVEAATGRVRSIGGTGFLLGIMPEEEYREQTVQLAAGDRLCFFTDGLTEARNEIGEMFGEARLTGCLTGHRDASPKELIDHILACQTGFRGPVPLHDDLTIVVLELTV